MFITIVITIILITIIIITIAIIIIIIPVLTTICRHRDESRNTLVYADRAKNISNKVGTTNEL